MNCLGRLSRDSGHMRVPDPPHMITGMILVMHSSCLPAPFAIDSRAPFLCNNRHVKAMPRFGGSDQRRLDFARRNRSSAHDGEDGGGRRRQDKCEGGERNRQRHRLRDGARRQRRGQTGQRAEQRGGGEPDRGSGGRLARGQRKAARDDRARADPYQGEARNAQRESGLNADQSEAQGRNSERYDDETKVADAKANRVGVEAQRSLTGGKERRPQTGNGRQLRRFLAQQQRRPQRRREFRRDRDPDHNAEPKESRREGQSASPPRPDRRRSGKVTPRRAMVSAAGKREHERGENAGRPGRRAGGDQTAEDRAERHAGRRRGVQPGQNRAAKPALDPRPLSVHENVNHAAEEPREDQGDGDRSLARRVEQRTQRCAKHDRRDGERLINTKTMRERTTRRHRDEIGPGVDGQKNAECRRVNAGASQNRARGAAPKADADTEGEEHRGDGHLQRTAHGGGAGRRERAQKSVGAPPSALRRATKAVSASRRSISTGGGTKSRKRSATMRSAASTAGGEPASRQVS